MILPILDLKAKINALIKTNNRREITGAIENEVLNDIVDSLEAYGVSMFVSEVEPLVPVNGLWFVPSTSTLSIAVSGEWQEIVSGSIANPTFEYNATDNILTVKWDGVETFLNVKGIIDENNNGIVLKSGSDMAIS